MRRTIGFFLSGALAALSVVTAVEAADYTIDLAHSEVGFKVRHLGIASVRGEFTDFTGTFSYDPSVPESSRVRANIKAASVDTGVEGRDEHLRSEDFFHAGMFDEITFVSTGASRGEKGDLEVSGDLTIRGVTKPVVLDVALGGMVRDPWGGERAAFTATTSIDRRDFGLAWNRMLETGGVVVGERVEITLEIEGVMDGRPNS